MPDVTNNLKNPIEVFVGVKDGEARKEMLLPGERRNIPIDTSSAQVRGQILAGNITVAATPAKKTPKGSPEPTE